MKTLGLIGGTTWVSTVDYYKYINQLTNERLGGMSSAKILLYSVRYEGVKAMADAGDWESFGDFFSDIALNLEKAGAEAIVLCANTTHIVAEKVEQNISIPVIYITDATALEIQRQGLQTVALLGTKFTMENDFYHQRLARYNIETLTPSDEERDFIHWSIFEELGKNIFNAETKRKYLEIIRNLNERGAEGVILGCTEIPMLIKAEDCPIPSFDTTFLHAKAAVEYALAD